jgi:glutathione S-transferase
MKLHHAPLSGSSRRVTVVAQVLGLQLDEQIVDLMNPHERAGLTAINPNGKVPVLEDGDFRLWESHAIIQYLCDKTPGQTLYPKEPRARADINRWLFWISAHLGPPLGGLGWERVWKKYVMGTPADPTLVAYHEKAFHQVMKVVDDHLATRTYLVGETLTLADLSLAVTLAQNKLYGAPDEAYGHVRAHDARIHELDAWKRTEPPAVR